VATPQCREMRKNPSWTYFALIIVSNTGPVTIINTKMEFQGPACDLEFTSSSDIKLCAGKIALQFLDETLTGIDEDGMRLVASGSTGTTIDGGDKGNKSVK
jgi:hypothetical protein